MGTWMVRVALLILGLLAPSGEGLELRFVHEGACGAERPCREQGHWRIRAGDRVLAERSELEVLLGKEADAQRDGAPRPELSERIVFFAGDRGAPAGLLLGAMRDAAKVGIYKMAWLKEGSATGEMSMKYWLPDPDPPKLCTLKEEVTFVLKWDPKRRERVLRLNGRAAASHDDLMKELRALLARLRKTGRTEFQVFLDVERDLTWDDGSWGELEELMGRCRAEGLEQFEFVPALRRKAAEKK